MPKFKEHTVVKLRHNLLDFGLSTETTGVVVMVYAEQPQAYEVEFVDGQGRSLALLTLPEEDILAISASDSKVNAID